MGEKTERQSSDSAGYRKWTTGLVVFGGINILAGGFCFALAFLLILGALLAGLIGTKCSLLSIGAVLFSVLGIWFCGNGYGSIRARRWARALLDMGSWFGVVYGLLALIALFFILPDACTVLVETEAVPAALARRALQGTFGLLILLYLIASIAGTAFYGSGQVRKACEFHNPSSCWTDRHPLPLLGICLISLTGCLPVITALSTNYTACFFGKVLTGKEGALVIVLVAACSLAVGWGAFKEQVYAWWGAYLLVLALTASMMVTFASVEMSELYVFMGYGAEQSEMLCRFSPFGSSALIMVCCLWGIAACLYLVWVRDLFHPEKDTEIYSYRERKRQAAREARRFVPGRRRE